MQRRLIAILTVGILAVSAACLAGEHVYEDMVISEGDEYDYLTIHDGENETTKVKMRGGYVYDLFVTDSARFIMTGGRIADVYAQNSSTVTILDGELGDLMSYDTADVNIEGGLFHAGVQSDGASVMNIAGGDISGCVCALGSSTMNISGGSINDYLVALQFSVINIFGYELEYDPDSLYPNPWGPGYWEGGKVTGKWADGAEFAINLVDEWGHGEEVTFEHVVLHELGEPKTIYVDDDAGGANDGTSWEDAFTDLQDALTGAFSGDRIHVAQGIYTPAHPDGDRSVSFELKGELTIMGGYAGVSGDDPTVRDASTYKTILSGDLNGDDIKLDDPLDLPDEPTRSDNSYHVLRIEYNEGTTTLEGFIITGGIANGGQHDSWGGGLLGIEANLVVADCVFENNWALCGAVCVTRGGTTELTDCGFTGNGGTDGAALASDCHITVTRCEFVGNVAFGQGGAIDSDATDLNLIDCSFVANKAFGTYAAGGAVYLSCDNTEQDSSITNCIFRENWVEYEGGAISLEFCSPSITDCTFVDNTSMSNGGAINCYDSSLPVLTGCTFTSNTARQYGGAINGGRQMSRCSFVDNTAERGGAIYVSGQRGQGSLTLEQCLFDGNFSQEYGGAIIDHGLDLNFTDCNFSNNEIGNDSGSAIQIFEADFQFSGCLFEANIGKGALCCNRDTTGTIDDSVFRMNSGGAIRSYWADITVTDCSFIENQNDTNFWGGAAIANNYGNLSANRCVFRQNNSLKWGGAVSAEDNEEVYVKNSLFINNAAEEGGGLRFTDSFAEVVNCTFQGNSSTYGASIACNSRNQEYPSVVSVVNCILAEAGAPVWNNDISTIDISHSSVTGGWQGPGNIDADILFFDAEKGDFHLHPDSPCIDAGDNSVVQPGATDLDGYERIINGIVNMGAYEFRSPMSIYVDDDATGANDGMSWTDAFVDLQDALEFAWAGDEILVGQGTYTPAGINGDQEATFQLVDGVVLRGGFAGVNAEDPDKRDVQAFESILSGDLNGDDGPDMENVEDNSRHVLTGSGTGPATVLDGLVITAGIGSYNGSFGGGLYNVAGSPTVTNCIFTKIRGMRGYAGNAIYNFDGSSPSISNCIFEGNDHSRALSSGLMSVPTVVNCVFLDNRWAAIEQYGGEMVIANCIFAGCQWAMFLDYSDADVRNCLFFDNGLVVLLDGGAQPVFTNCIEDVYPLFVDRYGGDYHLQSGSPCIDSGDNSVIAPDATDLDGNERIANGVVDMGVFEMAAAVQADLRIVPQVIDRDNNRAMVLARLRLPEEVTIDQIDAEQILVLYPGEIEAEKQSFFSTGSSGQKIVHVFAFFDKDKLMQAVPENGDVELTVTGRLNDGTIYTGTDTIAIVGETQSPQGRHKRQRPPRRKN